MTVTPELPQIIDDAIETYARDRLFTAIPGQITKVYEDEGRQFVDVKPCLSNMLPNDREEYRATGKAFTLEEWPVVPHTPVAYPQGGGFFITLPLQAHDFVLIVCCQRSLDRWVEVAQKQSIASINPADVGTHVLDGAVAIPCGPMPKANLLRASSVSPADMILGRDGGVSIHLKPSDEIHLGSASAADFVALAAKVKAELQALWNAVNTHTHQVATTGSSSAQSGAAAAQAAALGTAGDVKASKVKAD